MSQLLQIAFRGVEEGEDPRAQPPGTLLLAENCAVDKARRLVKRAGTDPFPKGILGPVEESVSNGKRLQTRGDDLVIEDGEFALSYSPEFTAWQKVGRTSPLRITQRALIDATRSAVAVDVAVYNDLLIVAGLSGFFEDPVSYGRGSVLTLHIESLKTGARVFYKVIDPMAAWARLNVSDSSVILTYSTAGTGQVRVEKYSLATLAFEYGYQFAASSIPSTPCEASVATPSGGVPTLYVAWSVSGASRLAVAALRVSDLQLVAGPVYLSASPDGVNSISVAATPAGIHVLWSTFAAIGKVQIATLHPGTLATLYGTTTLVANGWAKYLSVVEYDETRLLISLNMGSISVPNELRTFLITKAGHVKSDTSNRVTYNVAGISRPWKLGERWFLAATMAVKAPNVLDVSSAPGASSVVVEIDFTEDPGTIWRQFKQDGPHTHVGTLKATTGWFPSRNGFVPQVSVSNGLAYVPAAYRNQEPVGFERIPVGWDLHRVQFATEDAHRLAVVGRGGLAAAGAPYWLDGGSSYPYGFAHPPVVSPTPSAGGGVMAAGDYGYVAVYEWRDANGVLHRSMPSPPATVTLSATGKATLEIAVSSLSNKQGPDAVNQEDTPNPVSIAIYRTTVGGSIYYRLTVAPDLQVLVNDPRVPVVYLVDTKADADIGDGVVPRPLNKQPQLYTLTGELEDIPPPSFVTVATHGGRLAGIDGSLRRVWMSKNATEDPGVAPGFHEGLTLGFGSDKTALATLDETLVVFGPDDIDIVFGSGPDATGLGAWQVGRVQSDVGCVNPRSVVTTPQGVAFQSPRGIELFDRSKALIWIGKSVEDTLAQYPVLTSAVLVADAHEVRWTCVAQDGASGIVLAFDYVHKIWFTRRYYDSTPFVDAALVGGVYTLLRADGQVYRETKSTHLDDGAYIEREIRLAPLSPAGNLAWHRVKDVSVLGESKSPHKLEIGIRRDYAETWEQTKIFDETPKSLEKVRVTLKNQKSRAIEVRIRDLAPEGELGSGEGPILYGLAFRVVVKAGVSKTSAEEQG